MRKFAPVALFFFSALRLPAQALPPPPPPPPKDLTLPWAFQVNPANIAKDVPKEKDNGMPRHIPGSSQAFTLNQIIDPYNQPDWFPGEHPAWPTVVQYGRKDLVVMACNFCHTQQGHPESADLAGLPAGYLIRAMAEFKSNEREGNIMNFFAQKLPEQDVKEAAEYYAALKPRAGYYKVVETTMVPQTYVDSEFMRFPRPGGAMEPLGKRIIMVPQDVERVESWDPNSGFIAYVPPGSVKKGKTLVETGGAGKTVACATCHDDGLRGMGQVPRLAGLDPIHVVRQLYRYQDGRNRGAWSPLMKKAVAKLTDEDILNIAAYVGSLTP